MGYTPTWTQVLLRLRLDGTEFARLTGIAQPHMARILRGELRNDLSDDMKDRINAVMARACPCCHQYVENSDAIDAEKAGDGASIGRARKEAGKNSPVS